MEKSNPMLLEIDRLIRLSRLREVEFILSTDEAQRVRDIAAALRRLRPGQYLLGTGPSTVGIVPLTARQTVLGRPPTILEGSAEPLVDYCVVDTLYFVPREVSRRHASIVRQTGNPGVCHVLFDLHSTCGTFVNEMRVDPDREGVVLKHGDVISLGPSQTSTYVYYQRRVVEPGGPAEQPGASWILLPPSEQST